MKSVTFKVLFIQSMRKELQEYFKEKLNEEDVDLIFFDDPTLEDLVKIAPDMDLLIGWRPDKKVLEAATKAIAFINPGVGVRRHIEPFKELNENREKPLILINGHGNAYFTAEHSVALLLSLYNKIVQYHNNMISGRWRDNNPGSSMTLKGKKIGLLGYGAINKYVHQFLSGFGVEILALKRNWVENEKLETFARYTPNELNKFLKEIDVLMLALPHTDETEGMIGIDELRLLGEDGVLINVARGKIVIEEDLYNALKDKVIAGAGIDVWYNYQPNEDENGAKYPTSYQFHTLENVVLSPHRAASPFDNLERWDEQIENIKRMISGRKDFLNIVDLDRQY